MSDFQPPIIVAGEEALAEFRQGLTGPRAFELLAEAQGRLLIQQAVGVGKTEWMVEIIRHAASETTSNYDLIVVMLPRWDILKEVLQRLPADIPRKVLRPRPRVRCGELDADWQQLEQHGCSQLGRKQLCGACPLVRRCYWPDQYRQLREARLVLTTQQHLVVNPHFIDQLRRATGAKRPLALIDESDILLRPCERTISGTDFARFIGALDAVAGSILQPPANMVKWREISGLMTQADNADLREGCWRLPEMNDEWAAELQRRGRELYGTSFRFIGFDLQHFGRSDAASRERLPGGGLRFAVPPYLGKDYIVFSGSIARELARYRLDPNHTRNGLFSPFERHRFEHPETKWYNLALADGTAQFFPRNAPFILDFFAALIARNISTGKRTLLVARKKFRRRCRDYLRGRLAELGAGKVKIVTGD